MTLILLVGFAMGGSLWWLHNHRDDFRAAALQGLVNEFQGEKERLAAIIPSEFQLNSQEAWSLEFQGDELWITAPALERKQGTQPLETTDFDQVRTLFTNELKDWLSKRPGDDRRFPIRLRFRNEPPAR